MRFSFSFCSSRNSHFYPLVFKSLILSLCLSSSGNDLSAIELFVHNSVGNDSNRGTREAPFATIQQAVKLAQPGDQITLLPPRAIYRQSVTFNNRQDLTIEGNLVTLEGADPLPETGWEDLGNELSRRMMPRTTYDRHLLIINHVTERMGRTQSSNSPEFPKPEQLTSGQFCFENLDEKRGWLYVKGSTKNLEWAVRVNGIATGGTTERITIRNLNARHFLNDGFNVHGKTTEFRCHTIQGYDCFDEGFSAHDDSECLIERGNFWGNENGIADVNRSITTYEECLFYGNVNVDVLLIGKQHSLKDCRIVNQTNATALAAGPREVSTEEPFRLTMTDVSIIGKQKNPARVRINGGLLKMQDCQFENVELNTIGAEIIE
ncbi:MAG TPA: hypothetical protein DD473_06060 [Planctomycetaceae bacterium]|nr:hypothetical protein [Planctomycetaceae bacterium]